MVNVEELFETYHAVAPGFITVTVLKILAKQKVHISNNCLPDPTTRSMNTELPRSAKASFTKFKSDRSTAQLEGIHSHLGYVITTNVASPETCDLMLMSIMTRWNMERGVQYNGDPSIRTYSIRKLNNLKILYLQHAELFKHDPLPQHDVLSSDIYDGDDKLYDGYYDLEQLDIELFGARWLVRPNKSLDQDKIELSDDVDDDPDSEGDFSDHSEVSDTKEETKDLQMICIRTLKDRGMELIDGEIELTPAVPITINGRIPAEVSTADEVYLFSKLLLEMLVPLNEIDYDLLTENWNKEVDLLIEKFGEKAALKVVKYKTTYQLQRFAKSVADKIKDDDFIESAVKKSTKKLTDLRRKITSFDVKPPAPNQIKRDKPVDVVGPKDVGYKCPNCGFVIRKLSDCECLPLIPAQKPAEKRGRKRKPEFEVDDAKNIYRSNVNRLLGLFEGVKEEC